MGSCLCRENLEASSSAASLNSLSFAVAAGHGGSKWLHVPQDVIEQLVLTTLHYITSFHGCGNITPAALTKLNKIADTEEGWCKVVLALICSIPLDDPLSMAALTLIFDDCPLPARETVVGFTRSLHLSAIRCHEAYESEDTARKERNLLAVLGCIAEKFAGPHSIDVLTREALVYLVTFLVQERHPNLMLHSMITLEKFALTAENKERINQFLRKLLLHPFLPLELYQNSELYLFQQIGFCAKWALDNIFIFPGRRFSFEDVDMEGINVILHSADGSEYIKISPDGLEARSDSHTFESVRGTFEITSDCWYYEANLITDGVMQIGWSSNKTNFQNHEGYGVGDDEFSLAYDGCRRLLWYKAHSRSHLAMPCWQAGDILGCLIDVTRQEAIFTLNGELIAVCNELFQHCQEGFYPSASFMSHQQCRFNFGATPFIYPPLDRQFRNMNEFGVLSDEEKRVIPRWLRFEQLQLEERVAGRRCIICMSDTGDYGVDPCEHGDFCIKCVQMVRSCPVCRCPVKGHMILSL